jgi:hypothetical protein
MRVEGQAEDDGSQIVTESQNISASGVYCTSSHYLAPLSKVALTIVLPRLPGGRAAKELIKCEGIVVRCDATARKSDRQFELACMFSGLDDRRRVLIDEFVSWRNLQALRAAARDANGTRVRRTRSATVARTRRKTTVRRKTTARRRTVH